MIGETLGTYRLIEKLGEGGMGEVYRALDEMLDRDVALKMLRPELARRQSTVDRFRAEAITLAKLDHPGIARIHGCSRHDERWFIVMEFVRGETLLGRLRRAGRLPWIEAVPIVCQLLDGLEYAHRRGVIHRDMKPANVLMPAEGGVKITDFGIARVMGTERATRTGHIVGTLEYMSPEQVRGEEVDGRADLYAVGILLFELLTGRVPFRGGAEYEVLTQHLRAPVPSVLPLAPDTPAWMDAILQRALAKAPADRFASAAAFQLALEGQAAAEPAMRIKATRLANSVMDAAVVSATGPLPRATDPQAVVPTLPGAETAPTMLGSPTAPTVLAPKFATTSLSPDAPATHTAVEAPVPAGSAPMAAPAPAAPPLATSRTGIPPWVIVTAAGTVLLVTAAMIAAAVVVGRRFYAPRTEVAQTETAGGEAAPPMPPPDAVIIDAPPSPPVGDAAAAATEPAPIRPATGTAGQPPTRPTPASGGPAPAQPGATGPEATPAADHAPVAASPSPAPEPAPAPAPVVPAPPRAEHAEAVEFDEVGLITFAGDDLEEREVVVRFEADGLVLVDADSETAIRALPYRSLTDATYARTRRPVAKAERDRPTLVRGVAKGGGLFRRVPHWLTVEGAGGIVSLKVDGGEAERMVKLLEARSTVKVERVSDK